MKEKFNNRLEKQEQTIQALRIELEELRAELELADNLDAIEAEAYLTLLGRSPPESSSSNSPEPYQQVIDSSSKLVSAPPLVPAATTTTDEKVSATAATPLSRAGRRIANRLRAYSSDTEVEPASSSFSLPPSNRPRRLSKPPPPNSAFYRFPTSSSPTISKPTLIKRSSPELNPGRTAPNPSPGPPLAPVLNEAEFGKLGQRDEEEGREAKGESQGFGGIRRPVERKKKASKPPVSGMKRERKGSFGAAFTSTLSKCACSLGLVLPRHSFGTDYRFERLVFPAHNADGHRRGANEMPPDQDLDKEIQSWVKNSGSAGYGVPT